MTTGVIQYPHYQTLALYKLRTPTFYYLPKIHKNKNPPPGWPIVSGPNGPTYGLNLLVDHFLTDLEDRIPYLLKDTTTFLNYIDTHPPIQEDTILVTMDVSSLYTNIPHQEGIDLVVQFYRKHQPSLLNTFQTLTQNPKKPSVYPPDCQLLEQMLSHILRYNTFEFNNEFYVQKQGTAMGAPFAVKFANIVMDMLLRQIAPLYTQKPTYRLIDDLFFVWDGSQTDLDIYMEALNNYRPWLKFTAETSTEKVPFLDTVVYKHQHKLHTTLHIKPTDRQQYLHANSCHPRHTKNSLPYSQALRYRRNISQNANLDTQVTNLTNAFVNRGYKKFAIQTQI